MREIGVRLVPSLVGAQRISNRRRTRTLRPSVKPCHMAPEACGRPDGYCIETNRTVEELLADQENRFFLSILAEAATSRWTSPRTRSGRRPYATRPHVRRVRKMAQASAERSKRSPRKGPAPLYLGTRPTCKKGSRTVLTPVGSRGSKAPRRTRILHLRPKPCRM